jgi:hypothetical protein
MEAQRHSTGAAPVVIEGTTLGYRKTVKPPPDFTNMLDYSVRGHAGSRRRRSHSHPRGIAGRRHAVMGAEGLVTAGLIAAGIGIEIAEGGGRAVGPVLRGRAAQTPQGILKANGQGGKALASEHGFGVL